VVSQCDEPAWHSPIPQGMMEGGERIG